MKAKTIFVSILVAAVAAMSCGAQNLSVHWEELTAPDFVKAVGKAEGVCIIPMGVIEKHGPHAGERETSEVIYARPDLVKMGQVNSQSGEDMHRLDIGDLRPGIFWYASYPNHYGGNAVNANAELGELCCREEARILAEKIRTVKSDKTAPALQREFFEKSAAPLKTKQ